MNPEQNKNQERNTLDVDAASILAESLQLSPEELVELDDTIDALEGEWCTDGFEVAAFLTKETQTLVAIGRRIDEQTEELTAKFMRFYAQGDVRDIYIPVESTKQSINATVRRTGDEVSSENIYYLRNEPEQDDDDTAWLRATFGNRLDVRTRNGVTQLIGGLQQYEGAVEYSAVLQRRQELENHIAHEKQREINVAHDEALQVEQQAQTAANNVRKGLFQSAAKYEELQQNTYRNAVHNPYSVGKK